MRLPYLQPKQLFSRTYFHFSLWRLTMESETGQVNVYEPDGYDFEFLDELSKDQECPICHAAMRNPVQTAKCGHRFCKNCLLRTFR